MTDGGSGTPVREPVLEERMAHGAGRTLLIAAAVVIALSSFYIAPKLSSTNTAVITTTGGSPVPGGQLLPQATSDPNHPNPGATVGPAGSTGGGNALVVPPGLTCTGNNGAKTDVGVDARNVYLASTEVESGIGQSFLGPVRYGMLAVQQKVNRQGGVCGRQLHLQLKDDGWDAGPGKTDLDNFIQSQQYFALAVVPSSEGLNAASQAKDIVRAPDSVTGSMGIPVVGTDGMLNSQYTDPWIWPVAASTATSMRIMAHHAIAAGAHDLAIVYDQNYRFGPEGAGAFVKQAQREGHNVPTACRIALTTGQQGYGTQAKSFNDNCKNTDFVALLLEPQTAQTWLRESPYLGTRADGTGKGFGGPQPLFDKQFGDNCGDTCKNMEIWTSMYPPIYPYDQQAAVRTFKQDLCAVDNDCNVHALSAFTEGGYAGMELLVAALQKTSPYLTRERLKATLDSLTLDDGVNGVLTFKPGAHNANLTMVAFKDTYSGGSASFQYEDGSQQTDPCPSCQDPALNQ